jgi:SOUL heme-binding protein
MTVAVGVLVIIFGAWTTVGYVSTKGIETPAYDVLTEADGYDIREYRPQIRAEVTVSGDYGEALNAGFRKVADYIFGNNTSNAKVAMTAPVLTEGPSGDSRKIAMTAPVVHEGDVSGRTHTIAFVMPGEYTMETLPRPNNPEVTLREVPSRRFAVLTFRGYATESRVTKKTAKIKSALERDGVEVSGEPTVAQYDPPWTPPYMRQNEIWIPVP